jgi:hypothetical protein
VGCFAGRKWDPAVWPNTLLRAQRVAPGNSKLSLFATVSVS